MLGGVLMQLGPMALLGYAGGPGEEAVDVDVIVGSARQQPYTQSIFHHLGVEPTAQKILALKSSVHFRAASRTWPKPFSWSRPPASTSPTRAISLPAAAAGDAAQAWRRMSRLNASRRGALSGPDHSRIRASAVNNTASSSNAVATMKRSAGSG